MNIITTIKSSIKNFAITHTQIGRRVKAGVEHAKEAINIPMEEIANSNDLFARVEEDFSKKGVKAFNNLRTDKEFIKTVKKFCFRKIADGKKINITFDSKFYQTLIELLGVGATKFSQIISCEPGLMAKIEKKFGPEFAKGFKNTKSSCFPTRTKKEAQETIRRAFPDEKITVLKRLGVASVGETYLVKRADGSKAVCKMIKKGVDRDVLALEEKILNKIAKEFVDTPEEFNKINKQLKNLYTEWSKELNLALETKNNKLLQKDAKRYKVANITNYADDGSCIIMDMAQGIKMDELMIILKDYKANPKDFATKYADKIVENPWLSNPEKIIKELPTAILKAFDEQFMFIKKGGKSIMHADPHTGNFFISTDKNGNLIPEFIDTGSCVTRSSAQIKDEIAFFANLFVGNSKIIAQYYVKQCNYKGADKADLIEKIAKDLDSKIFGKKQNIRHFPEVLAHINEILEKHGLSVSPENTTAKKAQIQFLSAVVGASKLSNGGIDMLTIIKDIPKACFSMIKNGENPFKTICDAIVYAFHNQKQAVGNAYQFIMPVKPSNALKPVDNVVNNANTVSV